jgi:hypothetical protein
MILRSARADITHLVIVERESTGQRAWADVVNPQPSLVNGDGGYRVDVLHTLGDGGGIQRSNNTQGV